MEWIGSKIRVFQATAALSAIVASAIVLWVNVPPGRVFHPTRFQFGLLGLPWLVGMVAFTPIAYVSWSKSVRSTTGKWMIRAFLAVFLAAVLTIFATFYGHFVFQFFSGLVSLLDAQLLLPAYV